ncbi:nuclear transport factor 2 family protein [Rouxiella badensis]|uniref:nuclear transport factor 2 family protein n=1 Tax=Yersiniaceae TaxID=1903411 RepID=UPI001C255997|nr:MULTISPECIES: nuclear transport factor 2 family protein [Yersiniaceae]MBU9811162.1 nuclear transport factor 2 family protein [Rahnella perminowiae]MBU9865996.1 nuclear transport factor 2 family protein [Rahnella aceris]MCC3735602.1 nuclear transport factor 2 family protein [Rouxiella badensis]MCC3760944.1 nuclear transport factor 2 family protein [Rouxiella badensis]
MSITYALPMWFAKAIQALQSGNIEEWMNIYAADAVHEFPFAPPGWVVKLEGREQIGAYMSQLPALLHFGSLSDIRVREVGDELIVEAIGHHRRTSDNTPRYINYVWFITLHNGKVTHIRDYMNPLQLSTS